MMEGESGVGRNKGAVMGRMGVSSCCLGVCVFISEQLRRYYHSALPKLLNNIQHLIHAA
jgi:hypothetical protein